MQREGNLIVDPPPDLQLRAGDYLGLIGETGQLDAAERALRAPRETPPEPTVAYDAAMRVLIVEDDDTIAAFVAKGLEEAGFAVDRAAEATRASREPHRHS